MYSSIPAGGAPACGEGVPRGRRGRDAPPHWRARGTAAGRRRACVTARVRVRVRVRVGVRVRVRAAGPEPAGDARV